ncbi:MAG: hypothetical protein ACRDWE_04110 [Acidimicrobiales bacterium]
MLDHLLVDFIAAVQESFDRALLERGTLEERFLVDVFLGDLSWEASYSLPGEGQPPRVRVDLTVEWSTWSQAAYRSWSIGETPADMPEAVIEVALRIQRLAEAPAPARVLAVLPPFSPPIGGDPLVRTATTVEEVHGELAQADEPADGAALEERPVHWAIEGSYQGTIRFDEAQLDDPSTLVPITDALTGWVSSTLVRMADLPLSFHPPDPADAQ